MIILAIIRISLIILIKLVTSKIKGTRSDTAALRSIAPSGTCRNMKYDATLKKFRHHDQD